MKKCLILCLALVMALAMAAQAYVRNVSNPKGYEPAGAPDCSVQACGYHPVPPVGAKTVNNWG